MMKDQYIYIYIAFSSHFHVKELHGVVNGIFILMILHFRAPNDN